MPGENRELELTRLVDVARGAVDDDAGDALGLGRGAEDAAPGGSVGAAVLDDDDVTGVRGLDGGGAEVAGRLAVGLGAVDQAHGDDAAGDLRRRRRRRDAEHDADLAEAVEGVRNGAGIELKQTLNEVVHGSSPWPRWAIEIESGGANVILREAARRGKHEPFTA